MKLDELKAEYKERCEDGLFGNQREYKNWDVIMRLIAALEKAVEQRDAYSLGNYLAPAYAEKDLARDNAELSKILEGK